MQEAEGAIPSVPTIHARVAQFTEHGASNAGDEGETPFASAIFPGCIVSSRRLGSEPGGRRCESCHPDHFWKAGRYKLAAPVPKTGSAQTRGRSITDAFRHFGRVPTLNHKPERKEILCDPSSVTKASCSIARATNRVVS